MKLKFKVCDLTGAVESSGIIGDNNYNVALHDASFFGSNTFIDRGYKYKILTMKAQNNSDAYLKLLLDEGRISFKNYFFRQGAEKLGIKTYELINNR